MHKCYNCGAEFEGDYCTYCGVPAPQNTPAPVPPQPNDYSNPQQGYSNAQQNYQQNPYSQPVYGYNTEKPTTSTGMWFCWQLLELIPLIGIIVMLCASEDESVKNYAKARLIWWGISFGLMLLVFGSAFLMAVNL